MVLLEVDDTVAPFEVRQLARGVLPLNASKEVVWALVLCGGGGKGLLSFPFPFVLRDLVRRRFNPTCCSQDCALLLALPIFGEVVSTFLSTGGAGFERVRRFEGN